MLIEDKDEAPKPTNDDEEQHTQEQKELINDGEEHHAQEQTKCVKDDEEQHAQEQKDDEEDESVTLLLPDETMKTTFSEKSSSLNTSLESLSLHDDDNDDDACDQVNDDDLLNNTVNY